MHKKVTHLLPSEKINMGGIMIKQALPTGNVDQVDPFLLLHHGRLKFANNAPAIQRGVGPHPHRGFSPVTFVIEGEIHHRDSRGNNQIAKAGEVQWMHAGMGIIHSERPTDHVIENGGVQEMVQLWINTPADKKMQQPSYQFVPEADMPFFLSDDGLIRNKVIAGQYNDQQSSTKTESELLILWGAGSKGGAQTLTIPKGFNSSLYVVRGSLNIAGYGLVEKEHFAVFDEEGDTLEIITQADTQFLLLCGAPINEKVVQQGPFVMNSETEILEAMRDYQMGKMGFLVEEDV